MKYIRKAVILLIAVVLLASVVIGAGVILSVRNVNVTLVGNSYAADGEETRAEIAKYKEKISRKVKGSLMFSVSEGNLDGVIDGDEYEIESFKKLYPCTLNVTLRERRETFATALSEGGFSVYDENGKYISYKETNVNGLDGAPNLLLEGAESEEDLKTLVNVSKEFKAAFSSLRGIAQRAVLTKARVQTEKDRITFYLHSGLKIELLDCLVGVKEKLTAASTVYSGLSAEKRLSGTVFCSYSEGAASVIYSA